MNEDMTNQELKTIFEMVILILEESASKEEAIEKIKSLDILKND